MSAKKRLRPLGDVLLDMEPLIEEMVEGHSLQWGDVLNLVRGYLEVHCPRSREEYEDGSGSPEFFYGGKK